MEDGPLGVLFLDRRGSIVSANRSAEWMLAAGNGIYQWHGTLRASAPIDDTRIGRLVSGALPRFGRIPAGGYQSVRRSSGLPLIVHVHPVTPARADFGAERVAVLVLVRDPDANRFDPQTVGDALGLTPAESRVAVLVGMGKRVPEIARELDRSENTVRWTLKNVLSKTDSARQADLVRLLLQLPPGDRGM